MLIEFLPSTIGAAACIPAILLLWLVVIADRRPEPPLRVLAALLGGIVAIFIARFLRLPFEQIAAATGIADSHLPLYVLFGVSVPEETAKVAIIALFVMSRRLCDEPMDGAVFGAAVGLGFAAYENLGYLTRFGEHWQMLALVRNVLTVPFHGALGIIAGGYLARLRFGHASGRSRRPISGKARLGVFAWLVPVILHALFDGALYAQRALADVDAQRQIVLLGFAILLGGGTIALATRQVLKLSRHQRSLGSRTPIREWRTVWTFVFVGGAAGFVGAAFMASALISGILEDWLDAALGIALLAAALATFHWSGRRLVEAAPAEDA